MNNPQNQQGNHYEDGSMLFPFNQNNSNHQNKSYLLEQQREILALFPLTHHRFISEMLQGGQDIGMDQWRILSALSTRPGGLASLSDPNTRQMMLLMMKDGAITHYKSSYFNRVRISPMHLQYLQELGTALFMDITLLISKLPILIAWYTSHQCICHMPQTMGCPATMGCTATIHEEYTAVTYNINQLIALCTSTKRSLNNNISKFKVIADSQDRVEIVREMGKMLRQAWKWQKANLKQERDRRKEEDKSIQMQALHKNMAISPYMTLNIPNNKVQHNNKSSSSVSREIYMDRNNGNNGNTQLSVDFPSCNNVQFAAEWQFSQYQQ